MTKCIVNLAKRANALPLVTKRFSGRPAASIAYHRNIEFNVLDASALVGPNEAVTMHGVTMRLADLRRDPQDMPTHITEPFSVKVEMHQQPAFGAGVTACFSVTVCVSTENE